MCDDPTVHFPQLPVTGASFGSCVGICLLCYTGLVQIDRLERRGRIDDGIRLGLEDK